MSYENELKNRIREVYLNYENIKGFATSREKEHALNHFNKLSDFFERTFGYKAY